VALLAAASVEDTHAAPQYHTVAVDGVKIFYREAGDPHAPTVLLLHGFPTSSHMYRNLIPLLADHYHVVAGSSRLRLFRGSRAESVSLHV